MCQQLQHFLAVLLVSCLIVESAGAAAHATSVLPFTSFSSAMDFQAITPPLDHFEGLPSVRQFRREARVFYAIKEVRFNGRMGALSSRQQETIRSLIKGAVTNQEQAEDLGSPYGTIKRRWVAINKALKMKYAGRALLLREGFRKGWIELRLEKSTTAGETFPQNQFSWDRPYLTPRQWQLLGLLFDGIVAPTELASRLGLAWHTIESLFMRTRRQLGLHGGGEAADLYLAAIKFFGHPAPLKKRGPEAAALAKGSGTLKRPQISSSERRSQFNGPEKPFVDPVGKLYGNVRFEDGDLPEIGGSGNKEKPSTGVPKAESPLHAAIRQIEELIHAGDILRRDPFHAALRIATALIEDLQGIQHDFDVQNLVDRWQTRYPHSERRFEFEQIPFFIAYSKSLHRQATDHISHRSPESTPILSRLVELILDPRAAKEREELDAMETTFKIRIQDLPQKIFATKQEIEVRTRGATHPVNVAVSLTAKYSFLEKAQTFNWSFWVAGKRRHLTFRDHSLILPGESFELVLSKPLPDDRRFIPFNSICKPSRVQRESRDFVDTLIANLKDGAIVRAIPIGVLNPLTLRRSDKSALQNAVIVPSDEIPCGPYAARVRPGTNESQAIIVDVMPESDMREQLEAEGILAAAPDLDRPLRTSVRMRGPSGISEHRNQKTKLSLPPEGDHQAVVDWLNKAGWQDLRRVFSHDVASTIKEARLMVGPIKALTDLLVMSGNIGLGFREQGLLVRIRSVFRLANEEPHKNSAQAPDEFTIGQLESLYEAKNNSGKIIFSRYAAIRQTDFGEDLSTIKMGLLDLRPKGFVFVDGLSDLRLTPAAMKVIGRNASVGSTSMGRHVARLANGDLPETELGLNLLTTYPPFLRMRDLASLGMKVAESVRRSPRKGWMYYYRFGANGSARIDEYLTRKATESAEIVIHMVLPESILNPLIGATLLWFLLVHDRGWQGRQARIDKADSRFQRVMDKLGDLDAFAGLKITPRRSAKQYDFTIPMLSTALMDGVDKYMMTKLHWARGPERRAA